LFKKLKIMQFKPLILEDITPAYGAEIPPTFSKTGFNQAGYKAF
jgi:hypothetical protein